MDLYFPKSQNQTMRSKSFFKKDYVLIIGVAVMYFLMTKNVILPFVHLIFAAVVSLYFFPLKLFIAPTFKITTIRNKIIAELSYFVISNIILLTALSSFLDPEGSIHTVIYIYGLINLAFVIYFYLTKNMHYHFLLTACTTLLIGVVIGIGV